jgi:hypothetical protein
MATMDTLAALYLCRYVQLVRVQHHTLSAGTAGSSASKRGEKENCPGTIEAHSTLPYSVASDAKLPETRM